MFRSYDHLHAEIYYLELLVTTDPSSSGFWSLAVEDKPKFLLVCREERGGYASVVTEREVRFYIIVFPLRAGKNCGRRRGKMRIT
jgi:hypothetical protein